jgi:hypothetical protein
MVDLATNLNGVHPNKVIGVYEPLCLKLLLTNGTRRVGNGGILGYGHISVLRLLFSCSPSPRRSVCSLFERRFINLTVFDPFLAKVSDGHQLFKETLTFSPIYQLRWIPRLAASGSLTLKCQSIWRAFFSFPCGVFSNRRPQVAHWLGYASYSREMRWNRGLRSISWTSKHLSGGLTFSWRLSSAQSRQVRLWAQKIVESWAQTPRAWRRKAYWEAGGLSARSAAILRYRVLLQKAGVERDIEALAVAVPE